MDNIKRIPLAERIRSVVPNKASLPLAMFLYAEDFLGVAGEITGQEERYEKIYQTCVAPYDGTGETEKRVCDLAADADRQRPADRKNLLFWLLVEPFVSIETMERRETQE